MAELRYLNEQGIAAFSAFLAELASDGTIAPPRHLLTEADHSSPVPGDLEVEDRVFASKLEMSRYVAQAFPEAVRESNPLARSIWAWLSLFWIDQLIPADPASGVRKPNKEWYYVPSDSHFVEYRHLLLGPYRTYRSYGEQARLLLAHPLSVWSDVEEQLAGKRDFLRLPGALAVADLLYFDAARGKPKRGITNRKKPGNIRRLRDVVKQFTRTYDIHTMTGAQFLLLLPKEFDAFRS